ncbi:MAG: hypothetical protein HY326_14275 [Chloroflexi bacterium]|nr:hypothetical protein [Chloroflexota bacterium]
MFNIASPKKLIVIAILAVLAGVIIACGATPTPAVQIQEKLVTQVVTQVVEKQVTVQVKETVVIEKVVEKPVLITPTPVPTAPGSDKAADQTIHYVTRGFGRLDPAYEAGFGTFIITNIWMPLFIRDNKHNLVPWLATKYEVNADSTVYTVSINPKAVWSDGSPVTAKEAKDYWTYALDPKACVACFFATGIGFDIVKGAKDIVDGKSQDLTGVVAKDDKTIEFTLNAPDPIFIHRLALWDTGFAKMEDVKKGPEYAKDGTARVNGPYMVKIWDVDKKQYEIVQNPKWWGDKKPTITRIIAMEAADENVSFIQWQNNEVDIAHWQTNIREPLRKTAPESFFLMPYAVNVYFPLWIKLPPMDDLNVRKALTHAVDWNLAVNAAYEGSRNSRVMTTHLTPELNCYKKDNWPEFGFNVAKAKQELAASKYPTPDKLGKIRITTGGASPNYLRMGEIIQEQWKTNLGITDVEVKSGSLDAYGQDKDSVQVRRSSWGANIPDPADMINNLYVYWSDPGRGGLKDTALEPMLKDMNATKRTDPGFCAKVQAAEAKLLGNYYLMPIVWEPFEMNAKPWVKNFAVNVDLGWYSLVDIYLAKH